MVDFNKNVNNDELLMSPSQAEEAVKNHYLNGLQIATKKRYFPQIAQKTEKCRNNTMVPNSNMNETGT